MLVCNGAVMLLYSEAPSHLKILFLLEKDTDSGALIQGLSAGHLPCTIEQCHNIPQLDAIIAARADSIDAVVIDLAAEYLSSARLLMQISRNLPLILLVPACHEKWLWQSDLFKSDYFLIKDTAGGFLSLLPLVLMRAISDSREQEGRLRAEMDLLEQRLSLNQIVEGSPVASFVIDCHHQITHWNTACELFTGISACEMVGTKNQWQAFYSEPRSMLADLMLDNTLNTGRVDQEEKQISANLQGIYEAEDYFEDINGLARWIYFTSSPIRDVRGKIVGAMETMQDVSHRHDVEAALQASEAFLAQIVDGSSVATFVIDRDHRVTHWNRACEALTGLAAREVIGSRGQWRAFYPSPRPVMADLIMNGAMATEVDQFYHGKFRPSPLIEGVFEAEDFFPQFGTEGKWVFFTAAPLRDMEGSVVGAIETLQDMNERHLAEEALKASEARYRELSITDGMTGLFNSRHFYETIDSELERSRRYNRPLSILLLDIDNFKKVNDQYGHLEGDKVLQSLAMLIRGCLREMDSAYRYGGEEFIVILPETGSISATMVAERLRQSFADTLQQPMSGEAFHCTVSIGVSQFINGDDALSLVKRADEGTYQAKRKGKNCVVQTGAHLP